MLVFSRCGGRVLAASHKTPSRAASIGHASENAALRSYWLGDETDSFEWAG
jgi:hypothetical protein